MKNICDGLAYMHEREVYHRDLGSHNVLLVEPEFDRAVIIDLGSSSKGSDTAFTLSVASKLCFESIERSKMNSDSRSGNMGPQFLESSSEMREAIDNYALGMIFAQMVEPQSSWFQLDPQVQDMKSKKRVDGRGPSLRTGGYSSTVVELIDSSLADEPKYRPTPIAFLQKLSTVESYFAQWSSMRWFDEDRSRCMPSEFALNQLPNLYMQHSWPDGKAVAHGDEAYAVFLDNLRAFRFHNPSALTDDQSKRMHEILKRPPRISLLKSEDVTLLGDLTRIIYKTDPKDRDPPPKGGDLSKRPPISWKDSQKGVAWSRLRSLSDVLSNGFSLFVSSEEETEFSAPTEKERSDLFEFMKGVLFVDPFGNVICPLAKPRFPGNADIDHIFPWILGGRTAINEANSNRERSNLVMLHWKANRHVKKDIPLQFLNPAVLQTGMTASAFFQLFQSSAESKKVSVLETLLGWNPLVPDDVSDLPSWMSPKEATDPKYKLKTRERMLEDLKQLAAKEKFHKSKATVSKGKK